MDSTALDATELNNRALDETASNDRASNDRASGDRILTFELKQPIRWGDMDSMGHVNNTLYFRYMEQTRISWFDHMGYAPNPHGQGPIIINAHCTFIKELVYPGDILCRHYVGEFGRSTFETQIEIERSDQPGLVYASGGSKVVWVDFPTRKSVALTENIRAMVAKPWVGST